jgi:hypothetical protein
MKARPLLLAGALLVSACTTPMRGLEQSPTFTPAALSQGMAVGGVVSAGPPLDPGLRMAYADLLRTAFREKRPQLTILTADAVANALGEDGYRELLREYRELGSPSRDLLHTLGQRLEAARYLVLARIDRDQTRRWTTEEPLKNSKGKEIGTKTHYRNGRTVGVSLRIIDLQSGETAWSGMVEKDAYNENVTEERDHAAGHDRKQSAGKDMRDAALAGLALGALDALLGDDAADPPAAAADPYPDPPSTSGLLEQAFRGGAENLPSF